MNTVVLAASRANADALEKGRTRIAELVGELGMLVTNARSAAGRSGGDLAQADLDRLSDWIEATGLPVTHAVAEAAGRISVDDKAKNLLVRTTALAEERLREAARDLTTAEGPFAMTAIAARAGEAAEAALAAASELALPALAEDAAVDLAAVLGEVLNPAPAPAAEPAPSEGHACACGGHDEPGMPELDTRLIPHAIRHATIFGALDALTPGRGIELVANHNPLPLLAQLEARAGDAFQVDYLEEGPEVFRLAIVRR